MKRQMSETIRLGILLAFSGGFMDAYSYIMRDHVFANAQTGNLLLLGVHLSEGNLQLAFQYLLPPLFFAVGIFLAEITRVAARRLHWRQFAVLLEALIFTVVAFIPLEFNLIANSLISFACGVQVESFRKIHGNGIATTMCIGNLRSGTQNLFQYTHSRFRDHKSGSRMLLYYGIICCFVLGAVAGNFCIDIWQEKAILVSAGFMLVAFFIMFFDYVEGKEPK